jgi:hypothetical protein
MVPWWLLIVFLLVGAGGAWWYAGKAAKIASENYKSAKAVIEDGQEAVKSVQYLAFAPIGTAPDTLADAADRLWRWAGLEEKGWPKG